MKKRNEVALRIEKNENCKQSGFEQTTQEEITCTICDKIKVGKSQYEIHLIEHKISNLEAQEKIRKFLDNFKLFRDNPENISMGEMWKMLKKDLA